MFYLINFVEIDFMSYMLSNFKIININGEGVTVD